MRMLRRSIIGLAALVAVGAGLLLLVPRLRSPINPSSGNATTSGNPTTSSASGGAAAGSLDAPPETPSVPTSEDLIAEALEANSIGYEASLLQRAYALFDDARLERRFRSPVQNWEAAMGLLHEVDVKEDTLGNDLLKALEPFRVRPSDPGSIFNRPRADVVKAQLSRHGEWEGVQVAGTRVRLWNKGPLARRAVYEQMIQQIWPVFPSYFPYPLSDSGTSDNPDNTVDPDGAIDIYLVDGRAVDPRSEDCEAGRFAPVDPLSPLSEDCAVGGQGDQGIAYKTPSWRPGRTSGYIVVNRGLSDEVMRDTIAHEIAHTSQFQYATDEGMWLAESTATWVAYKVMKRLQKVPAWEYDWLKYRSKPADIGEFFSTLHFSLHYSPRRYGGWIFFQYASMELGNGVVTKVWEQAASPQVNGLDAVNAVVPLDVHFPNFALRNWNQETVPKKYETVDGNFPPDIKPQWILEKKFVQPRTFEIGQAISRVSSMYYRFTFTPSIRTVTYQSLRFSLPEGTPRPHVWAIKQVQGTWKDPEDWTEDGERAFCRDEPTEDLSELIIIVSNSHLTGSLPAQPKLRLVGEDKGCPYLRGWGKSTLRLKNAERNMDISYVSSSAQLRFRPRTVQDQPGNVQYDLLPTSVTWTAAGRADGCTVEGQTVATIPAYVDQPLDPTRLAYGYLNVVGKDGGDFHSVQISAVNPAAVITKTCPGKPPTVTTEPFRVRWLLNVLSQPNTHIGNAAMFRGTQNFDPARIQNNLPMSPDSALSSLLNSPVRGFITPEIQRQLKEAQAAMDRVAVESGGQFVYSFEWELQP